MKNSVLLAVIFLSLCSCRDQVSSKVPLENYYFTQAQPANDSELSEFPNRFLGKYQSDDATFLNIEKKQILVESYTKFKIAKTALDTLKQTYTYTGQKLISKTDREYYDVVPQGDSLELSLKEIDTVFVFSEKNKAKKINGNIVLSRKDSVYWKTEWLHFEKDKLKSNLIFSETDRKRVDSLVQTKIVTLGPKSYILKPTRREFGKILRLRKFGSEQTYTKIKTI